MNKLGLDLRVGMHAIFYLDDSDLTGRAIEMEAAGVVNTTSSMAGWRRSMSRP